MKTGGLILTALFGGLWLLLGLNGFAGLVPLPGPSTDGGQDLLRALEAARWPIPVAHGAAMGAGAALLARRFVPLAVLVTLLLVAGLSLYALFQDAAALPWALLLAGAWAAVAWGNRGALAPAVRP
jgi:hypothetical protein